jgi:hypothetical protein
MQSAPRSRGCSSHAGGGHPCRRVDPVLAGMFPRRSAASTSRSGRPRAPRGCSRLVALLGGTGEVGPAPAGMLPLSGTPSTWAPRRPPYPRRCSARRPDRVWGRGVGPAPVGMLPRLTGGLGSATGGATKSASGSRSVRTMSAGRREQCWRTTRSPLQHRLPVRTLPVTFARSGTTSHFPRLQTGSRGLDTPGRAAASAADGLNSCSTSDCVRRWKYTACGRHSIFSIARAASISPRGGARLARDARVDHLQGDGIQPSKGPFETWRYRSVAS